MNVELPENWMTCVLGDLLHKSHQRNPVNEPDKAFVYIDVSSVSNSLYRITETSELLGKEAPSRARKIINVYDVIYATVRPTLKRVSIIPKYLDNQICSTGFCVLKPNTAKITTGFLYYYLLTDFFTKKMASIQRGASYPAVRDSDIKNQLIPYPPLPEQQKIAAVLSTVQRAIELQNELIERTIELKKSMMHKLFTEGVNGERQKETEIGMVPESWEVVEFSKYIEIQNGQVNPKEQPFSQMIHVGPENIERDTGRLINLQTNEALGIKSGNYYFSNEYILYSKIRPYLNKVALPEFEGTCSADMYPLKPDQNVFKRKYLFQLFLSDSFKKQAISHQDRTGIPKINRNQLGSVLILKPSINEQNEIGDMLESIDLKIEFHTQKKIKLEELFRTLLHQLMTAQVRVDELEIIS